MQITMRNQRRNGLLALLSLLCAPACIETTSGLSQQHNTPVTIEGYTTEPNQIVDFYLVNRRGASPGAEPGRSVLGYWSGVFPHVTWNQLTATTASTETSPGSGLYEFTATATTSMLPAAAWIPQVEDGHTQGGLKRSGGRVEIVAQTRSSDPYRLNTYSPAAVACAEEAADENEIAICADGDTWVVFDNDGVGVSGAAPTWTPVAGQPALGFTVGSPSGTVPNVRMELGSYTVPGLTAPVRGVICRPHPVTAHRTVVLNHGGFVIDAIGLDTCVRWARAGWVTAMTAYRHEAITRAVPPPPPGQPEYMPQFTYPAQVETLTASGLSHELCLGEVTDTLHWLDIVRARPDTLDDEILMWGHSHGACVTLRALEQGAQVKAAVAVAAPTEFTTWYNPSALPEIITGFNTMLGGTPTTIPDAYRARSAARMAVDLERRSDTRLLMIAVERDTAVHVSQSCLLAGLIGAENHFMGALGAWGTSATPTGPNFTGCTASSLTYTAGAPATWDRPATFLLYPNTSPYDGHVWFGAHTPTPSNTWAVPNQAIGEFMAAAAFP
jgi:dienelactone hydrolase